MAIPRVKTVLDAGADDDNVIDKDAYAEKLEAQLNEWRAEIDQMQARAKEAGEDARAFYQEEVDKLRAKQHEAEQQLGALREVQGKAWEDVKAGFEAAWDDLGQAVEKASARFR